MWKPILAVIAGFALWTVMWLCTGAAASAIAPDAMQPGQPINNIALLLSILGMSAICSLAGGASARLIAPHARAAVPLSLGAVLLLVGIGVQASAWDTMPLWYHLPFLALLIPMTLLGWGLARSVRPRLEFA